MNTLLTKPLDKMLPHIAQAVQDWQLQNPAETLKNRVHQTLNKRADEIVLKLLGFDKSWGSWELDHCNGRSGNSAAGDFLREIQTEAIKEWLANVSMPQLSQTALTKLGKDMRHHYQEALRNELYALTQSRAKTDAQALIDSLTQSDDIDVFLATMKLINPVPDTPE